MVLSHRYKFKAIGMRERFQRRGYPGAMAEGFFIEIVI